MGVKHMGNELRTIKELEIEYFDHSRLEQYLTAVKKERRNLAALSDTEIMELMGVTQKGEFTLAAALVFGIYPQTWFPQLCITAIALPGTAMGETDSEGARFLDNKRITGSIPDMLEEAVDFVSKNMRTKTIIDVNGRRADKDEYPIIAVREAILNALIHRDYSTLTENTPISIEMFRDRIEIISKGGLFGGGSVDQLGKGRPETRNPALANILELLRVTENRYSGIPTIRRASKESGLPEPEFLVERGTFIVRMRNGMGMSDEDIDKTDIYRAVIQFCSVPRTREEITRFTGKSRYYTMSSIVHPLVLQGRLKMTIPDKPKSSNQQYYSTR